MHDAYWLNAIVLALEIAGVISITLIGVGLYYLYQRIKDGKFTDDDGVQ